MSSKKMMLTIDTDDEIDDEVVSDNEDTDENVTIDSSAKHKPKSSKVRKGAVGVSDGTSRSKGVNKFLFTFDDDDDDVGDSMQVLDYNNDRGDDSNSHSDNDVDSRSDDDVDGDGDGDGDVVNKIDSIRSMPHSEGRAIRASSKAEKQKVKKDMDDKSKILEEMNEADEAAYFDQVIHSSSSRSDTDSHQMLFTELNLSRPLLRAIEAAGYTTPTVVQAKVIPLAMAGRDICASAVTGSGKTAAFVLPFLERLLYRPKENAAIRVLIVSPTRELATQTFSVVKILSQFTDVTYSLICGGSKDVKSQEVGLRNRPDVVVCTPGRIIDHLRNSHSISLDDLDVLVLDEVDRLLDMGFQDELEELLKYCPTNRQTLLFSATMTSKVDDLAKLSLKRPVRVKASEGTLTVAPRLIQEFVKVRNDNEKEGMIASLICRTFGKKCILFFEMKKDAHRFYIILKLLNIKVCELHGDVSQSQRYIAFNNFKNNIVDVMVCTDVAARGLDIPGIYTVINAEMPRNPSTYIHRVGRTARAGCGGRAITLVSDARRKVMKEVLKGEGSVLSKDGGQILSRTIAVTISNDYTNRIMKLEGKIVDAMKEEKLMAKLDRIEGEALRVENLMHFEDEIAARPARTWYQTETQKKAIKDASKANIKSNGSSNDDNSNSSSSSSNDVVHNSIETNEHRGTKSHNPSALEKMNALSRSDKYEMDDNDKKKDHRLSRKKKRRIEALKDLEDDNDDSNDAGNAKGGKKVSAMAIERAPKRAKVASRANDEEKKHKVAGDMGFKKSQTGKIVRPRIALGGLEQDMLDWGGGSASVNKKALKAEKNEKEFTEFDMNKKLRKQGKLGRKAFKSKSKFKRRK